MRWVVFLIFAVLGLVFDTGLAEVLRIEKAWSIRPSLCAAVAVFVALSAPRATALFACLGLGLLLDLSNPLTADTGRSLYLIGPYTLGYAAGGWLVVQARPMVFRRRPITVGVMTFACLLAVQLVAITVFVLRSRSWYPGGPVQWTELTAWVELVKRLLIALYSGLLAVPVGWVLVRSAPLWGFQTVVHRSATIR